MVRARFENDTTTVNVSCESQVTSVCVGGNQSHSTLSGRDSPNQHPMSAITGLIDSLNKKLENANETAVKFWIGTESSWREENIASSHPEWLCFVLGLGVMMGNVTIAECVTPINEWTDND